MEGMVKRVEEYKRRIEAAVDADFNVKDMPTVLECVEHLENLPLIDTQILLDTRIGKIVNDLRRKLPPEEAKFGKRLKNLAKTWLARLDFLLDPFDWLIDWLTYLLAYSFTALLVYWLIDWLFAWLIGCFSKLKFDCSHVQ